MMRSDFFLLSLIVLQASGTPLYAEDPKRLAGTDSPNIITVFIDDMGWSDLSCFGGKAVETENIDRLAAEGIRLRSQSHQF
jgi:hypothetical protein